MTQEIFNPELYKSEQEALLKKYGLLSNKKVKRDQWLKNTLIGLGIIAGILALFNPSVHDFREFKPLQQEDGFYKERLEISRQSNWLLFSIYECRYTYYTDGSEKHPKNYKEEITRYIGIFNNFYNITPEKEQTGYVMDENGTLHR